MFIFIYISMHGLISSVEHNACVHNCNRSRFVRGRRRENNNQKEVKRTNKTNVPHIKCIYFNFFSFFVHFYSKLRDLFCTKIMKRNEYPFIDEISSSFSFCLSVFTCKYVHFLVMEQKRRKKKNGIFIEVKMYEIFFFMQGILISITFLDGPTIVEWT